MRRTLEGIDGHLASLAAEIAPLEAELAREQALAAAEERRKQFEALSQRAWARRKRLEALYLEMTRELSAQHKDLAALNNDCREFLGGNVASKIYDEMGFHLKLINLGWCQQNEVFGPRQDIVVLPMVLPRQ